MSVICTTAEGENSQATVEGGRVQFLQLLKLLWRNWRLITGVPVLTSLLIAMISLAIPNSYTGVARLLPPQQGGGGMASALLSQIGGGIGGALGGGLAAGLGLKNPADLYVGLLRTDAVSDAVIKRFRLQQVYSENNLVDTRQRLDEISEIKAGREGIIVVAVTDEIPERAAALANAYAEELDRLARSLEITEASQRLRYLEGQLKASKENLSEAELGLRRVQEKTGLISLEEQGKAIIEGVATMRAQIAAKEIQIDAMRTFSTPRNPDFLLAEQELKALRAQSEKLEKRSQVIGEGNVLVPTGMVPEVALEYVRRLRDLKYNEQLFEFIAKQYEVAKADAMKDTPAIQFVDRADIPDKKSRPKRFLLVMIAGFLAVLASIVFVILRSFVPKRS